MLSPPEIAILARLRRSEATTTAIRREVTEAPKAQPTLARLLRRLESHGLIRRRPAHESSFDRLLAWSLTEAGERALEEVLATFATMQAKSGGHDQDAVREYIAAGKDTLLWLRKCLVAPPAANRRVIIDRAIKRCHAALVALGELPADQE